MESTLVLHLLNYIAARTIYHRYSLKRQPRPIPKTTLSDGEINDETMRLVFGTCIINHYYKSLDLARK